MIETAPLVRLFQAMDGLLAHYQTAPWGAVVGDPRLPLIYDANYARIDAPTEDLELADVEAALLPVMEWTRSPHIHVVTLDPSGSRRLLGELHAAGARLTHDTAMAYERATPPEPALPVHEVGEFDQAFWGDQRRALPEFDVSDPATIEQFLRWQRDVLVPAGKRWFTVRGDGSAKGYGALFVQGDVAYVDDVVTFPEARGQGVAAAIITRLIREALGAGATRVYLLADEPGPIRLYERLGFRAVGEIVGSLRPRR